MKNPYGIGAYAKAVWQVLWGAIYERHHKKCEDCYEGGPLEGYEWVDCPRAKWLWERLI